MKMEKKGDKMMSSKEYGSKKGNEKASKKSSHTALKRVLGSDKYQTGRVGKDMYGKSKPVPNLKKMREDKIITTLD